MAGGIKKLVDFWESQKQLNKANPNKRATDPALSCGTPKDPEPQTKKEEPKKKPVVTVKIQEAPRTMVVLAPPNRAANTVVLHAINASPSGGEYVWTPKGGGAAAIQGPTNLSTLTVEAKSLGSADFEVKYTYEGESATDQCKVEVKAPRIEVKPSKLEYKPLNVGVRSPVQTVEVSNTGDATLKIDGYTLEPNSTHFDFTNSGTASTSIEPSDAPVKLNLEFVPTEGGQHRRDLMIRSNAVNTPEAEVQLVGKGLDPRIQATETVDFKILLLGAKAAEDVVKIKNIGKSTLVIREIVADGHEEFSHALEAWKGKALQPDEEQTLKVSFNPKEHGERKRTLTIKSDALNKAEWITELRGTVVRPLITVKPDPLDFGKFHLKDKASAPLKLVIGNTGDADLHISNIELTANPEGQWKLGAFDKEIKPNNEIEVPIEFESKGADKYEGKVKITSDAANTPEAEVTLKAGVFEIENLEMPEYLASGAEEVEIKYVIKDPGAVIDAGTFEVLGKDPQEVIFTRPLESSKDEWKHGNRVIKWKGEIKGAATGDFPDEHVSIQHSPYKVRITVSATGAPTKGTVERAFKVEAEKLELEAGDRSVLKTDKYKNVYDGTLPAKSGKNKLYLLSNIFKTDYLEREHNNRTDFNEYAALWGNGPLIPVLAKVLIKDSGGGSRLAPLAWGNGRVMWQHKNVAKTKGALGDRPWNFVQDAQNRLKDATNPKGDNCPGHETTPAEDLGGRRTIEGNRLHYMLPGDYGTLVQNFPFAVVQGSTRKWVAFSGPEKTTNAPLYGKSGVIFQPSRLAGDSFEVHAYLDAKAKYDKTGDITEPIHDHTGAFEIWREVEIRQGYGRDSSIAKFQANLIGDFYEKAFIKLTDKSSGSLVTLPDYVTKLMSTVGTYYDTRMRRAVKPQGSQTGKAAVVMYTWTEFLNGERDKYITDNSAFYTSSPRDTWSLPQKQTDAEGKVKTQLTSAWSCTATDLEKKYKEKCENTATSVLKTVCNEVLGTVTDPGIVVFMFDYKCAIQGTNRDDEESVNAEALIGSEYNHLTRTRTAYMQYRPRAAYTDRPMESTIAHEFGHCMFLPHTQTEDAAKDPDAHDKSDNHCLMSYNYNRERQLCGYCLLRLRGWDHANLGPESPANRRLPKIGVSAAGDFGVVGVNTESPPKTFTITNTGQAPLEISGISLASGDTDQYKLQIGVPGLPWTIAPSGPAKTFTLVFAPTSVGAKTVDVRVDSNDPGGGRVVTVNSEAKAPAIETSVANMVVADIAFGDVMSERASIKTVTVKNTGHIPLVVGQIAIDGLHRADFRILNDHVSGQSIAPTASQTFDIEINAPFKGAKQAQLSIPSNALDSPKLLGVTANCKEIGILTVSVATQDGGTVAANAQGAVQTIRLGNSGNGSLMVRTAITSGAHPNQFKMTGDDSYWIICEFIKPGATWDLTWKFCPTSAGAKTAIITIRWKESDVDQPDHVVTITGTGT